jgi:hypothetical protein
MATSKGEEMSEITAPPFAERAAGANEAGRRRRRVWVIATVVLAVVVGAGVVGVGGAVALGKIHRLEHQRDGLRRDKAALVSTKAQDEAALKATRSTLAETSAQVATMKAKVAQAQAAVKQAQDAASGQYVQGYSAGSNDSYNNGYTSGYNSGYNDGYNQGFTDGYGG